MVMIDDATASQVWSRDGTGIGYWSSGHGPPLLLVHGLLGDHSRWAAMLPHLEPHVTVYAMDRRGRGGSGDALDYAAAREFEDVAAVVDDIAEASGSPVDVLGSSGGAMYAQGASTLTSNIRRLVLFEPPTGALAELVPPDLLAHLDALQAADDREGILTLAYRTIVGLSDVEIEQLRAQPAWPNRVAAAHTVPRELRCIPESCDRVQAAEITVPTLVLVGADTAEPYQASAEAVAAALPDGKLRVLDGQGHAAELFAAEAVAGHVLTFLHEQREPSPRRG